MGKLIGQDGLAISTVLSWKMSLERSPHETSVWPWTALLNAPRSSVQYTKWLQTIWVFLFFPRSSRKVSRMWFWQKLSELRAIETNFLIQPSG